MANIKIVVDGPLMDGHKITFKAPCNCDIVEKLKVCYVENASQQSRLFTMKDSHGNDLTGLGNLFFEGAYVDVVLDTVNGVAYLQNAATNSYLENKLAEVFQSVSDGKALIASAITDMEVPTDATATFAEMAEHILAIESGVDTSDATALASEITVGKTAYVNGVKVIGTRPVPVTSQSASNIRAGTFGSPSADWFYKGNTYTLSVVFSTPFDKTPTIYFTNPSSSLTCSATNVSRTGFTFKIVCSTDAKVKVGWRAEG